MCDNMSMRINQFELKIKWFNSQDIKVKHTYFCTGNEAYRKCWDSAKECVTV